MLINKTLLLSVTRTAQMYMMKSAGIVSSDLLITQNVITLFYTFINDCNYNDSIN